MNDSIKTQISAFIDGELPENEAELLLRRMSQDRELRQQAAEYLEMGRVVRGERSVPGMENLRQRISDELDDKSEHLEFDVPDSGAPRYTRPLAGFAIVATVALAAIFGLQQIASVTDINSVPGSDSAAVAESADGGAYTVPNQLDDQLREYYLRHNASSSYFGANSINARLVTLQLRDGVIVESDAEISPSDEDKETVDEETTATAPE
jgi:negative regulator of sigma E activity